MDLCNRYDVRGQNSLYVTGIDVSYSEKEITDFFNVNGEVAKVVKIPDETGQPTGRALIEYASDRTIPRLDPATVGDLPSPRDPSVTWHVRAIREICQEELGRELAQRYLTELRTLHGNSKAGFFDVLQNELQTLQPETHPSQQSDAHSPTRQPDLTSDPEHGTNDSQYETMGSTHSPRGMTDEQVQDHSSETQETRPAFITPDAPSSDISSHTPHINESVFNPPHIQKVVVEHKMRSELSPSSYSQCRIHMFSGRLPKSNGEVDYDAWRIQVELLICDSSLSESQRVRRVLGSLLSPAADIVKSLGTSAPLSAYLEQLEAAFGMVEDGEELFATFLSSNQNSGEKPSTYLNRLQVLLTKAISRGGVSAKDSNKHLLRQFCRGCWDQSLIVGLQLEHQKSSPPSFPELLLVLRTEEDRRSAKLERMRKHLGNTKAASHIHSVFSMPTYDPDPDIAVPKKQDNTHKLEKEVAELRKQVASLTQKEKCDVKETDTSCSPIRNKSEAKGDCLIAGAVNPRPALKVSTYQKPWFCFRCGQDGHIAANCENEANLALVRKKNSELRVRREKYQMKQEGSQQVLNY